MSEAGSASDVLSGPDVSRRVVRGGALRLAGYVANNLLAVVSSVFLLRHLGVADFGRYGTVLALIQISAAITDAGLTITGSRELSLREPGPARRELIGTILGIRLVLCTLGVLACLGFAVVAGYDDAMVAGVALAGIGSVLLAAQATLALPLPVNLRNGLLTLSELIKQVVLVVGVVALVIVGAGLVSFFAIQVAIGAVALLSVPFFVGRHERSGPRWHLDEWKRLTLTALPIAAASVLAMLYLRVLTVMSSLLSSEFQTGLFVTSARIVEMVGALPLLFAGVVLPVAAVAARDDRGRLRYMLDRITEASLLLGLLTAVVLVLGAKPIVLLLGGEEFADAAPVLQIQGLAIVTIFLVQAWTTFLIADGRQRDLVKAIGVGLVSVLVAGAVLIPLADANGAALAAVIADVTYAAVALFFVRRVTDGGVPLNASFSARLALALAPAVAIGVLPGVPDVVAAAAGGLVFAALAVILRLVPEDVWNALPRWRRA